MNINKVIKTFSDFLNHSWSIVLPLLSGRTYTSDESSIDNWLQANWELLVERKVLPIRENLEVYGSGADYYGSSSRMIDIDSIHTHYILVEVDKQNDILNDEIIEFSQFKFQQLVGFEGGFYTMKPPFDYVLVEDELTHIERVFLLQSVNIILKEIT